MIMNIKESMLVRKCLNNYVLENNLEYDKSPLIMGIMDKLKSLENYKSYSKGYENAKDGDLLVDCQRIVLDDKRNELKKELKKYSIQTKCNRKILELEELERVENKRKITCTSCHKLFKATNRLECPSCETMIINKRSK